MNADVDPGLAGVESSNRGRPVTGDLFSARQAEIFFGADVYARIMLGLIIYGVIWIFALDPVLGTFAEVGFDQALWGIVIGYGVCALIVPLVLLFRARLRQQQQLLNEEVAADWRNLPEDTFLVTYLRPFLTSGRLRVLNLDENLARRHLYGASWDIELPLTKAVTENDGVLIAIGHQERALGAAKLQSSDSNWKETFADLCKRSDLILALPLGRPATLWEMQQISRSPELSAKTVFLMPPSQTIAAPFTSARVRYLWSRSRRELKKQGVELPAYKAKGLVFAMAGGQVIAECETKRFHPTALAEIVSTMRYPLGGRSVVRGSMFDRCKQPIHELKRRYRIGLVSVFNPTWYLAILFAFCLGSFGYKLYRTPSGSMQPSLQVGDYLLAEKWPYGFSRYSWTTSTSSGLLLLPRLFWPRGRSVGALPRRGDVVVFRPPLEPDQDFVKRIVGLPGDHIQMIDGVLHINGVPVRRERFGLARCPDAALEAGEHPIPVYRETLPNGVSYLTCERGATELDNTRDIVVPAGHYFMLGDDRDNSADSRVPSLVGFVPLDNIVGRVRRTLWGFDLTTSWFAPWTLVTGFRRERFNADVNNPSLAP